MIKSTSLRLYPTKLQEVILAKNFGCVRKGFDPSSKMCSCGVKNTQLGSEEFWICPSCNQYHDRDVLAANNIKEFGLLKVRATEGSSGSNASGDESTLSSLKEESNVA